MAKRHMKKMLNITNHQRNANKTIIRYQLTSFRMAIKNSTREMWRKETLVCCMWDCKLVLPLWKIVERFLKKLKIKLPFDSTILLMCNYSKQKH